MLVYQQSLASLPKRDTELFDGNPLQYHAFMQSFEQIGLTIRGIASTTWSNTPGGSNNS